MYDETENGLKWLVMLIVLLVAAAAVIVHPELLSLRRGPAPNSCINILRQIDGAKLQWAMENHKLTNDVPSWQDIQPYLHTPVSCPQGGTYTLGRVADLPACSILAHKLPPRE